eukprot:763429-Hanusia_phi.AAC.3
MQPSAGNGTSLSPWSNKTSNVTGPNPAASHNAGLVQQEPFLAAIQQNERAEVTGEKRPRGRPKGSKDSQPRKKKMNKSDKDSDDNAVDVHPARRRGRPIGSKDSHPRRRKRPLPGFPEEELGPEAPSSSENISTSFDSHCSNAFVKKSGVSSSETSAGENRSVCSETRSHPLSSADLIQSLSKELSRSLGHPPSISSLPTTSPMFNLRGCSLPQTTVTSSCIGAGPQLLASISPSSSVFPLSTGIFRSGLLDMQSSLSCMPILLPPAGILSQLPLQAGALSSIMSSRPVSIFHSFASPSFLLEDGLAVDASSPQQVRHRITAG